MYKIYFYLPIFFVSKEIFAPVDLEKGWKNIKISGDLTVYSLPRICGIFHYLILLKIL